jgi:biotin transport system substrate-specific component
MGISGRGENMIGYSVALPRLRVERVGLVIVFAVLTGLASRVVLYLPGNPVPMTLQVLAVLLSGLVLGWPGGALSQVAYLGAVLAGLPLDARMLGPAAMLGPTGGYLIGFVLAAAVAGWLSDRAAGCHPLLLLAALAGLLALYGCGAAGLAGWAGLGLERAWALGVKPFLGVDAAKVLAAVAIARTLRR